jgi:hypothetical protein
VALRSLGLGWLGHDSLRGIDGSKVQLFAPTGVPLPDQACRLGISIQEATKQMRGIILWLLGVPLVVIILLYVFNVL